MKKEEKSKKQAEYDRRYIQKIDKLAKSGDLKAMELKKRRTRQKKYSAVKSFIRLHATRAEIAEIRDVLAGRVKELSQKGKSKKD